MRLKKKFNVKVNWRSFQRRIKGKGQGSVYSYFKVKYSYMGVRGNTSLQDKDYMNRGHLKIYDTTPALIGGLFADRERYLLDYCSIIFEKFFNIELEIDQEEAVASVISTLGMLSESYLEYFNGEALRAYENALEEATEDQIFSVPLFVIDGH